MLNIIFSDLVSLIKLQTELKKVKMSLFFFRLYSHFKENGKKLTQIRGHVKKMSSGFTINVHLFFSFGSNLLKISKNHWEIQFQIQSCTNVIIFLKVPKQYIIKVFLL